MAETMTKEREKAINSVAESVTELAEIFREIQVLVIDQGTILDRIDYNIEQAATRVDFADGEGTRLYISTSTGEVIARRNDVWRFYDFFWMLHIRRGRPRSRS